MQRSLILALLLIIFTVVFSLQNSEPISIQFFFWKLNYSPAVLVPIGVLIGAISGVLFSIPAIRKKNKKIEELENKMKKDDEMEEENGSSLFS